MRIDNPTNESKTHVKDLLLEEYRYLSSSFWKNEQTGETRFNLFIGIMTAVVGGLAILVSSEHGPRGEPLRMIILASLSGLLALGIITMLRLLVRNETTDDYKRSCDAIRQIFKDHFDDDHILLNYYPFAPKTSLPHSGPDEYPKVISYRKVGGLAHTVAVTNSLLIAGLACAAVYPIPSAPALVLHAWSLGWTYVFAAVPFCLGIVLQFAYIKRREKLDRSGILRGRTTHAGGIVYCLKDDAVQYLLVGPKEEIANEWLLPKGHIESREGHGEAALREIREESGVIARLICLVGAGEFVTSKERVNTKYYLMERLYETARSESRRVQWFRFDEALKLLTHDQNKHLLREAERKRVALPGKSAEKNCGEESNRN